MAEILERDDYSLWDDFLGEYEVNGTVFHTTSYLLSLAGSLNAKLQIAVIRDGNNRIIAGCPFFSREIFGVIKLSQMPYATPFLGPVIRPRETNIQSKKESYNSKLIKDLTEFFKARGYSYYMFVFHPSETDIREFLWNGLESQVHFTYFTELKDGGILDVFESSIKRQIKKAEKEDPTLVETVNESTISDSFRLIISSLDRQGKSFMFDQGAFSALVRELVRLGLLKLYNIYSGNIPVATTLVLFDRKTAYYWLAGSDPGMRQTGLNQILIYKILENLQKLGIERFDWFGANTPSIARYKSKFNPVLVPYFSVQYSDWKYKAMMRTKKLLNF